MKPDGASVERPCCGAVVLAAGESRRFGSPKLLMPFGGSTILGSVLSALVEASVGPIVVVARADGPEVQDLRHGDFTIVRNHDPAAGMVASVRMGVAALPEPLERFLIALGDQPRIRPEGIRQLILGHLEGGKGIAVPVYRGKRGHPVVFSSGYRREILALTDRQTLRELVDVHNDDVLEVPCESDACVRDVDTWEDYDNERLRWRAEQQPRSFR